MINTNSNLHHHNADKAALEKFGSIAADWWDPKGPMKALHQINPLRLSYLERHISLSGQKILDLGCGAGLLSESLAQKSAEVTAIDLSSEVLEIAKAHAIESQLEINYQLIAAESLAESHPHSFDVISCMELLEHVPDPSAIIQSCKTLLKPNGLVFFSTLNRTLKSYAFSIILAEYVLNYLPKGTHQYSQFIRPSELTHWAEDAGLELIDIQGIGYDPLHSEFKFSPKVDVNYCLCFRLPE